MLDTPSDMAKLEIPIIYVFEFLEKTCLKRSVKLDTILCSGLQNYLCYSQINSLSKENFTILLSLGYIIGLAVKLAIGQVCLFN
jgi:hypothetical protein